VNNTDAIIKDLHKEAAHLLKQDHDDETVIAALMTKGIERHYAEMVLENVKNDQSDTKEFYKHLFRGAFFFLAGLSMTIKGYSMASSGGIYIVFTGLMVYGIVQIIRSFIIFKHS
jgi:hypothetical protein